MDTLMAGIKVKTATLRMALVGCDYITGLGLSQLLRGGEFIDVAGSAAGSAEVLKLMAAGPVDMVLIDASMDAAELAQTCRLLNQVSVPPTVVVMGDVPFDLAESLVFSGVCAVLNQSLLAEDLPVALRMIHRGGALLIDSRSRETLMKRSRSFDAGQRTRFESLNPRERIIAQGVAEGSTNVQLAGSMHMSEATVKLIVSNVMTKLGVSNRVQIAVAVTKARVV